MPEKSRHRHINTHWLDMVFNPSEGTQTPQSVLIPIFWLSSVLCSWNDKDDEFLISNCISSYRNESWGSLHFLARREKHCKYSFDNLFLFLMGLCRCLQTDMNGWLDYNSAGSRIKWDTSQRMMNCRQISVWACLLLKANLFCLNVI